MKGKRTIIVLLLASAVAAVVVRHTNHNSSLRHSAHAGKTVYVSPTGTDSGKCGKEAPCASVAYASSLATAGDVVAMDPGTYGPQVIAGSGTPTAPLTITTLGPVLLTRPAPASAASQQTPLLSLHNQSYVTVHGLTLVGMKGRPDSLPTAAPGGSTGAEVLDDSGGGAWDTYVTFDHLTVLHSASGCIKVPAHDVITNNTLTDCGASGDTLAHGLYCAGGYNLIANNVIRTTSGYGIHCHGDTPQETIRNNTVSDAFYGGILAEGAGTIISGNVVHDNGWGMTVSPGITITSNLLYTNTRDNGMQHGYGIMFASQGNNVIENNTFYHDGISELSMTNGAVTAPVTILNNIVDGSSATAGFLSAPPAPGSQIDYNLYLNLSSPYATGSHSLWADPRFVHPGTNFLLRGRSPASGTALRVRLPFGKCGRNRGALC